MKRITPVFTGLLVLAAALPGLGRWYQQMPTDADLKKCTTMDDLIHALPEWGKIYPQKPDENKAGTPEKGKVTEGGRDYNVTRTKMSLTETPDSIATFQPVNAFWLGSIVQSSGLSLGIGSLNEVPVPAEKRVPFKVTTDKLFPLNSVTVDNPSSSSVKEAIAKIINSGENKITTGSDISFKSAENYTENQTAFELGLDANYMSVQVKSTLKSKNSATRHTYTAVYIEKAFTVSADFEGKGGADAFFNSKFTISDGHKLVDRKQLCTTNLPAYVKSITYGRMLICTMSAVASEADIAATLEAEFKAANGGAKIDAKASELLKNSSTEITVASVGGPTTATVDMIKSGKINDFFNTNAPLTSMVPISYTINSMREDKLASMAKTTEYTASEYTASPIGERFRIKFYWVILDASDGGDSNVECYGALRLNGSMFWEVTESQGKNDRAYKKKNRETIDCKNKASQDFEVDYIFNSPKDVEVRGELWDHDSGSANDVLYKANTFKFDPKKYAGLGEISWQPIGSERCAKLCMRVDKIKDL